MKLSRGFLLLAAYLSASSKLRAAGLRDRSLTSPDLKNQAFVGPRVAVQSDGKVLLHGQGFTAINGIKSALAVRYGADGSLDTGFNFSRDYYNVFTLGLHTN